MGAWGAGSFDNDDALDFAAEVAGAGGWSAVRAALARVADATDDAYVEAPQASVAIAAAEVVAAGLDSPTADLPPELEAWLEADRSGVTPDMTDRARRAVRRVGAASELADLWGESDPTEWRKAVADLEQRLVVAGTP